MKDFGDCKAKALVFQDTFEVRILQLITACMDALYCGGKPGFVNTTEAPRIVQKFEVLFP